MSKKEGKFNSRYSIIIINGQERQEVEVIIHKGKLYVVETLLNKLRSILCKCNLKLHMVLPLYYVLWTAVFNLKHNVSLLRGYLV